MSRDLPDIAIQMGFKMFQWFKKNKQIPGKVLDKGAKAVVLASHLGRPDGSVAARLKTGRP